MIKDIPTIRKIQDRFGFPKSMTVNGCWPVVVDGKDWDLLKETEKRGFIGICNHEIMKMKASELFIKRIREYLKKEADTDKEFAKIMQERPEKEIDAVRYILLKVSESKKYRWDDEEIYGIIKHFIDETKIKYHGESANDV